MPLRAKRDVSNLRNMQAATLGADPGSNLHFGLDGRGKTSVLEAIHLLAVGRSFRSHVQKPLGQEGSPESVVCGETATGQALGMRRPVRGQQTIHIDGRKAESLAELSRALPVQLLNTDTLQILEGSPQARRRFMDWGVFHVEHSFYEHWRRARQALQNRNVLLRQEGSDSELEPWTRELIRGSVEIDHLRETYLLRFQEHFQPCLSELMPEFAERLSLEYERGWSREYTLEQILERNLSRDRRLGFTSAGPHRAELRLRMGTYDAADILSRGQLKLLVCALKIAQARLLWTEAGIQCVFLVDDLPAELDAANRARVCEQLARLRVQVFLTAIEREALQGPLAGLESEGRGLRLFHVKHGIIAAV